MSVPWSANTSGKPFVPSSELDYEKIYSDILKQEHFVGYMYLDNRKSPCVTVGTGNMLPNAAAAQALPFINTATQMPATKEEIAAAFRKVASMTGSQHYTKYKQTPSLEISEDKSKELALSRLKEEFIPGIKRWVQGFDSLPVPAREALIDMAYNAGVGQDAGMVKGVWRPASGLHQFTHLKRALEQGDWNAAANASHSKSREERNKWRKDHFEEAGRIAARTKGNR